VVEESSGFDEKYEFVVVGRGVLSCGDFEVVWGVESGGW
jgi:hypothetical protein